MTSHSRPQEPICAQHEYLSTACLHQQHDRCRRACKFCQQPCTCSCHHPYQPQEDV